MNFTKDDTNIVKGIAILAMVFHHVYPNSTGTPYPLLENPTITSILASCGKICVALLTILSGYGLMESYKKTNKHQNIKFIFSHYLQLLSMYWIVLFCILFLSFLKGTNLSDIYGTNLIGIRNMIIDMFGLGMIFHTPVFIGGWYLTAIIAFYFLFPILAYLVQHTKIVILIISYTPWIYYIIKKDLNMHTDWFLFYLFSFVIGIFLSSFNILNKFKENASQKKYIFGSILFFVLSLILRIYITLPIDPFLSLSVIFLEIVLLAKTPVISNFLKTCGIHSANIWLIHPWLLGQTIPFRNYIARFIIIFCISISLSYTLENIKQATKYNVLIKGIRSHIL